MPKEQISSNDYSVKKSTQITNFNTYPEASRFSEIPEFIKNSQQQASAR